MVLALEFHTMEKVNTSNNETIEINSLKWEAKRLNLSMFPYNSMIS
jgi:hypothetical protein